MFYPWHYLSLRHPRYTITFPLFKGCRSFQNSLPLHNWRSFVGGPSSYLKAIPALLESSQIWTILQINLILENDEKVKQQTSNLNAKKYHPTDTFKCQLSLPSLICLIFLCTFLSYYGTPCLSNFSHKKNSKQI